jgi:uncharacterized protein YbaP (TraB family)
MKRALIIFIGFLPYLLSAQPPVKKKKYPSLLWEISGNGLKKPSFLFGTMHVSSKMAFHLADSFYIGIRNADMVALETNPESWQEDMSKYDVGNSEFRNFGFRTSNFTPEPDEFLRISTLRFYKYDKKIEKSLYSNPSTINNLLYRSYGNESSDFEEDTYLDMYIYQCGKKWGKKVAGVEKYGESMKLMMEAYKDAAKDRNTKERSYDADDGYSSGNLQEAYRTGNLDWLDSINKYNSFSSAFDEKFLYRRNEIQAGSIDSIIRTGQSLFAGVGAAHLPGERGVIEMLRDMGYKLRPVKMGERDSQHKNQVEKLRVPVAFIAQEAADGMYKVDIPGKFYKFGDDASLEQQQYADMANGSYYMVTRIMTNAWMWGHSEEKVQKTIDSLLYENIPGKIITKTPVVKNGYTGFDITNRTRRGDVQRYNIFITPFEIIIFKMSGTGDYVKNGDEAKRFFGSIQLKEFAPGAVQIPAPVWKKYCPLSGGFAINLPHEPYIGNDGSWIYDATDKSTHTHFRVIRTDIHNYSFAEEDTFDLGLLDESFASSEFIDKQLARKQTTYKGYPALDAQYRDKSGSIYMVRFIIQGPHYYTLVTYSKKETAQMRDFLNSFELKPYVYKQAAERKDTMLYYSVKTPVFPGSDREKLDLPRFNYTADEDDESEKDALANGLYRSKIIENDTTGEKIFVYFYKMQPYYYEKDSATLIKETKNPYFFGDTTWIIRSKKERVLPGNIRVWDIVVSDTGSSRIIRSKTFFKDGIGHALVTQSDTLTPPSDFINSFFESFIPVDTLKGTNPFRKKTDLYFADLASTDSASHQRAVKSIPIMNFDSTDLSMLKKAIHSLNWDEKKYLDTKKSMIAKLNDIPSKEVSNFLRELYYAAGDTVELQYAALETLLQQKTPYAFTVFRDIIINEPPVLSLSGSNRWQNNNQTPNSPSPYLNRNTNFSNGSFVDELYDSLKLTRTIFPDLLPLLNLDDYERIIMRLLGRMVDSNLVKAKDYEIYFSKFLLEAKQELKKQAIAEKKRSINRIEKEKEKDEKGTTGISSYNDDEKDFGNEELSLYATLLLPYYESKPAVQTLINQMLASNDKRLKYRTMLLLLRNNKPYPDSLLKFFAASDDYRYELYSDLKKVKKQSLFPAQYNNHVDLGKSKLVDEKVYGKPDSLLYIDRLPAEIKGKKGYVYFFRYKNKKDDATWKLATVGLIPEDPKRFEFEINGRIPDEDSYMDENNVLHHVYDFTEFGDARIREEQNLPEQLRKELKKMLYSRRKSAQEFYDKDYSEGRDTAGEEVYVE